ncbi:hypothetical protein TIFTF001_004315 [Ficus carica]|uniref:Uncharacterized protein n=1 Tax=Ficus carica TaxID=3494 RepID=A0AA87ZKF1_FICCA|nr:hypothetical protein TIFTF001_004315 [Ficus carica]
MGSSSHSIFFDETTVPIAQIYSSDDESAGGGGDLIFRSDLRDE